MNLMKVMKIGNTFPFMLYYLCFFFSFNVHVLACLLDISFISILIITRFVKLLLILLSTESIRKKKKELV